MAKKALSQRVTSRQKTFKIKAATSF